MAKTTSVLTRLRRICLSLPDTRETLTWGEPHFRVGDKIFCGCGDENSRPRIGFKLEREHAEAILQDPRFRRAPYVGHKGWVSMDASRVEDWTEVRALVLESYRLIAPKKTVGTVAGLEARRDRADSRPESRQRRAAPRHGEARKP
jgi:predicted DNA-binding protein (MmcQ/YjbR family)